MVKIPSQKTCHMKIFLTHVKGSCGTNKTERMITRHNVGSQEKQYLLTSTLTVAAQADTQKFVAPLKIERSCMKPQLGENLKAAHTVLYWVCLTRFW